MKQIKALMISFIITWSISGCAGFGSAELNDALPIGEGKVKVFGAIEYSPEIHNELFSKKNISDTVKYYTPKIYEHSNNIALTAHGGIIGGVSEKDELSIRAQFGLSVWNATLKVGYKRNLIRTSAHALSIYVNAGHTWIREFQYYNASRSDDEDNSNLRMNADVSHYKGGIVYSFGELDSADSYTRLYFGTSVQLNQGHSKTHGEVENWKLYLVTKNEYSITATQYRQWLMVIPYAGLHFGHDNWIVAEVSVPSWYDQILEKYIFQPTVSIGFEGLITD